MPKGYQNTTKNLYKKLNKTSNPYLRHFYIVQILKKENFYSLELVSELEQLTAVLLFNGQ